MFITSKLYPQANTLSYDAASFALTTVQQQLKNQTWAHCTRDELLEASVALVTRMDYLWENGGKQQFQEMLNREFGDQAITV